MDNNNLLPGSYEPAGLVPVPKNEEKPFFSASIEEKIAAFLMLIAAYIYTLMFDGENHRLWLGVFFGLFVLITELLNRKTRPTAESFIILACLTASVVSLIADRRAVWEGEQFFFAHAFAVWWVLSRSGALLSGESGHLIPIDAVRGAFVIPFKNFILQFRSIVSAFIGEKREKKGGAGAALAAVAVVVSAVLLIIAVSLLSGADARFGEAVQKLADALKIDAEVVLRLFMSIHIGAWLFGLIAGSARLDKPGLRARGERIENALSRLGRVPAAVWLVSSAAFAVIYASFFALQGSYLFGAFARKLPEGFVVAEYARQGFFELCRVMAVNFALVWRVTRTARRSPQNERLITAAALVILTESLVFAIIAASKLWLYIDCFGFTPRRLQSAWLIAVLASGCVAFALNIALGKRTMRPWLMFSAITLSATALL